MTLIKAVHGKKTGITAYVHHHTNGSYVVTLRANKFRRVPEYADAFNNIEDALNKAFAFARYGVQE